jgi:hypothetical protein
LIEEEDDGFEDYVTATEEKKEEKFEIDLLDFTKDVKQLEV